MISLFFSLFSWYVISISMLFFVFDSGNIPLHILSWLTVALLPVFLSLCRYIQKEAEAPVFTPVRLALISISLLLVSFFFSLDIITFLLVVTAVVIVFTHMDERILFALALVFLLGTVYSLLIDDRETAERLSILVYYSLVLGVIVSLIEKPLSRLLDRLPSYRFPVWWQSYVDELQSLMSLIHQLLPLIILGLLVWSVSPWGYLVYFDTQFIGSLVLIYVITSLVSRHEDKKIMRWLVIIMSMLSIFLTWWIFPLDLPLRIFLILVLLALMGLVYSRREYVKALAKKMLSL